ncbi:MAG TPA: zonular occludens toxin domain-containing protein [Paraburkholderia sp.]|jgi:zona occludens toxin|nr:zonular occludens toxin domain-containing protein [Paraburkholderia sp.]
MMTLITGTPGSGKTLYAVWMLEREQKRGRRLLVNGIRDLAVEHELLSDADVKRWHEVVQPNDILVVDEVQRIWPPVPQGTKPTEDIEKLHVHRHLGVDIFVITQHPQRMNKTVRDLVGRHVHVRRLFGLNRAMLYEWDHCHNPSSLKDAVRTSWPYPRNVFRLYTSAELHTKQKAVIPKALFLTPLAALVALGLGYYGFRYVHGGFGRGGDKAVATGKAGSVSGGAAGANAAVASKTWRVVGRFAIGGRAGVIVTDSSGKLRAVKGDDFKGDGVWLEGRVDDERVGVWTGAPDVGGSSVGGSASSVGTAVAAVSGGAK